jgi:predicted restriction endonuclease
MKGSNGGKKTAIRNGEIALTKYYQNPNTCKSCKNVILVPPGIRVSQVKLKKFCNQSCAATHNNILKKKKIKVKLFKQKLPKFNYLLDKNKGETFNFHSNWQSARTSIRKHAVYVFNNSSKPKVCIRCGYDKHIEVCHIKSVSEFNDETSILEINNINNLMALCPNHHWEFDNLKT